MADHDSSGRSLALVSCLIDGIDHHLLPFGIYLIDGIDSHLPAPRRGSGIQPQRSAWNATPLFIPPRLI
ncbi:hypothetical protein [Rosistilla ulvae]|nr:hypothetical protein [Rosistilla ulvae]